MLEFIQQHPIMILSIMGLLIFLVIHGIWYIRPSDVTTAAAINTYLVNGKPTIVEFYSNL